MMSGATVGECQSSCGSGDMVSGANVGECQSSCGSGDMVSGANVGGVNQVVAVVIW